MQATKPRPFFSPPLRDAVFTNVDTASPVTRDAEQADAAREAWQALLDRLIGWGSDPSQLAEEGTDVPSRETIRRAYFLAAELQRLDAPAPMRVVPDAHGSVVFEHRRGNVFVSIRISGDGTAECCVFENNRLASRQPWPQFVESE